MATVEVVSATSAFHEEKVEEANNTNTEEAVATVEAGVVAPAAAPQGAKETQTTTPTAAVPDESADATNAQAPTVDPVKATEEEVKAESIPKEAATSVEEENRTDEEEVAAPVEAPVAENVSDAPAEIEAEAEAEVAKEDGNVEEEKATEEVEDEVEAAAEAVAEVEEEIKKTEE